MKAEPPRNPARANARALELSDRDSNLETGGGNRDVDWYLFTGLDLRKLSQPLEDILAPVLVQILSAIRPLKLRCWCCALRSIMS